MKLGLIILSLVVALSSVAAAEGTRLLHQPDIHGDLVVFVYAADLWTVPAGGGEARLLTSHVGEEFYPKFSPDGKWIAFSGHYDGNIDVFIIPSEGGEPKRLTYHPGYDIVCDWTPDGKKVLFKSPRYSSNQPVNRLFTVDVKGGFPEMLPIPMAERADYSPDGLSIAYNPIRFWQPHWRRYRGGQTTPIWLIDLSDYSHVEIPHENASDLCPVWMDDTVYFLSDRNRNMNLFAYNVSSGELKQIVDNGEYDIENLSGDAVHLVYESFGDMYILDPENGKPEKIDVRVPGELRHIRSHYKNVSRQIFNFNLSPSGKRAVFEAHGEILTVPAEKGNIRNLTRSTGVCDRDPAWSPDGRYIAYFSDAEGEYALYIVDQKGQKPAEKVDLNPTFYFNPTWSPDSKKIAFTDKHFNIWYLDVEKKEPVLVDTDKYFLPGTTISTVWSPDSKWIAYEKKLDNYFRTIFVYSIESGESHQVTDGMSDAFSPSFDPEGRYLYFIASTNTGLTRGWLDLSSYDRNVSMNLYLAVLRKELPSPFAPESDEEKPEEEAEKEADKKDEKKEEEKEEKEPFRIDIENIGQRIISMPVPERFYTNLKAADGEKIFYMERIRNQEGATVHRFDMKERKPEEYLSGVSWYVLSADGTKLLYRMRNDYGIVSTSEKPKPGDGKLDLSGMEITVDPRAEWKQMLIEAWRINRDFLFDPGMHGVDWEAMLERYTSLLPYVAHRDDLNFLIAEMIGELCIGHAFVGGGDQPEVERVAGGLLGADYEILKGRYRITKIYSGLNWYPDLRAPLTEPGVDVSEGEYIIKVNGRDLKAPTNIYSLFENTAGKMVTLHVNSEPVEKGSRMVTVVPVESEMSLRNRDWIEGNRRRVDELSGGRLGYVYLPNTSVAGYSFFNRYFFAQLSKEGIVIDERFNQGGYAADYIIDMLDRPLMCYWAPRDGEDFTTPFAAVFGPKVMIVNEYAGSGGDLMPWMFKERGIGPLVGKRTWGGLVGMSGYPRLMDGGFVTAPSFSFFDRNGEWTVENEGVAPDVEVELIPAEVIKGRDPQLEKAVKLVLEELERHPFKRIKRPPYPIKK